VRALAAGARAARQWYLRHGATTHPAPSPSPTPSATPARPGSSEIQVYETFDSMNLREELLRGIYGAWARAQYL
jgi:hypothetical protein